MGNTRAGINREADTATILTLVCSHTSFPMHLRFRTSLPPSFHPLSPSLYVELQETVLVTYLATETSE
jgi:hypothetical protein